MLSRLFYHNLEVGLFPIAGCLVGFYYIYVPSFNANSVDPDQMLHSVASDLSLDCLPMSLICDVRQK